MKWRALLLVGVLMWVVGCEDNVEFPDFSGGSGVLHTYTYRVTGTGGVILAKIEWQDRGQIRTTEKAELPWTKVVNLTSKDLTDHPEPLLKATAIQNQLGSIHCAVYKGRYPNGELIAQENSRRAVNPTVTCS